MKSNNMEWNPLISKCGMEMRSTLFCSLQLQERNPNPPERNRAPPSLMAPPPPPPNSPPSLSSLLFLASAIFNLFFLSAAAASSDLSIGHRLAGGGGGLKSFKEKNSGSNITYECSPSGPCVPCLYSEKNDEKYRCSETGYRIPLKCVEIGADAGNSKKTQKGRSVLENTNEKVRLNVVLHDTKELTTSLSGRNLLEDHPRRVDQNLTLPIEAVYLQLMERSCRFLDLRSWCWVCCL